jgi:hypothetical protein
VTVDDGSGAIRTVIAPAALGGATIGTGDSVTVIGPLGQRDSSGTGLAGYRIHATRDGELILAAPPSPSPSPTSDPSQSLDPSASPTPGPSPTTSPEPSPAPDPSPTAGPTPSALPSPGPVGAPLSIADARRRAIGTTVAVSGVVTAEAGRLGTPSLIAIQDETAGIVVRLPDGVAGPARGTTVEVRGPLADPYGQLELRPAIAGFRVLAAAPLPSPIPVDAASLGEANESRVVTTAGVVQARPSRSTSGDISLDLRGSAGTVRIFADASSGLTPNSFVVGATYDVVGIAGQRASHKGALDGYRIWARDAGDLRRRTASGATPTPAPTPSSSPAASTQSITTVSIAAAIRAGTGTWTVEGLVTIAPDLLDTSGRRIVIEDRTAGLEILIPSDVRVPAVGNRVRVEGAIGRAWDAPRLKATRIEILATGIRPVPVTIGRPPTAALEWRLVHVTGTVIELHKLGDRWRAELAVGAQRVVITGVAGARIPVTTLAIGRQATIVGLVRRPYPGATDRRWSVIPRNPADVVASAAPAGGAGGGSASGTGGSASGQSSQSRGPQGSAGLGDRLAPLDVDLVSLADHVGQTVRVGGLVSSLIDDGFLLDDGTAVGRVRLGGSATGYLALLEAGDAVNATGRVEAAGDGFLLAVDEAAGLVRAGDPDGGAGGRAEAAAPVDPGSAGDAALPAASPGSIGASRLAGGLLDGALPEAAGLFGLAFASVVSVAVTAFRRYRARRLLASRMAARLATFGGARGSRA